MEEVEVPQYFLCPISLQIMKDPVTANTGITYDRHSIEQWLSASEQPVCPVTKQPLAKDSDLTPNHTLRRLIQAWCVANANKGVDRIPTPRTPLNPASVLKIARDLRNPRLLLGSLKKLETLAAESEKNRRCLLESVVAGSLISILIRRSSGAEECLKILNQIWSPTSEIKSLVSENYELLESITSMLEEESNGVVLSQAALLTKKIFEIVSSSVRERFDSRLINGMLRVIRDQITISPPTIKSALRVLIQISQCGKNRIRMIEANAIYDLIELEFELGSGIEVEKNRRKITEMIFSLLSQLCCCADGRARFLDHAMGIAVVSKRILRVSAAVDDRAVHIFAMLARFSATNETLQEMLSVGAVSKLCMVLQADCGKYLKDKASEILRMHIGVWNNSPCIQVYLLTRYPALQF